MSETVRFNRKIGRKLKVRPEEVKNVKVVNGAVTDLELRDGRTERVKGSQKKVKEKLGLGKDIKPGGLENISESLLKSDRKLKKFVNTN